MRMLAAVVGGAAFFGAAGLLAGQATGVTSKRDAPTVVAGVGSSRSSAAVGATPGATTPPADGVRPATTTTTLAPLGTKVAIVGDSLTEGIRSRLVPFAARYGFDAKIDAENGRDIEGSLSALKKAVTGRDLVVVALGTNDARSGLTAADARARIDQVMALVPSTPVLWVNVYRADTKATTAAAGVFDAELTTATSRYPNLTVLDWSSYITTRPELIGADHIHLTADGYDSRASWLASQIAVGLRLPLPDAPQLTR